MADPYGAMGAQSILNTPVGRRGGAQMDRRKLGQVVLRLQAQHIRSSVATEIEEFERFFQDILQIANFFLVTTERVADSSRLVIVDQPTVVKVVCHFLTSSNAILQFLDFQEQKTGLASGGDMSLETQVKEAQALVKELLNTLLLYKKAETYPGKECGLIYNEDIKVYGGYILHKYAHADVSYVPDPTDDNEDVGKLVQYWHTENLVHPLRHVPGTPWHKFFGNVKPGPIVSPALFRERKPQPFFRVVFPTTITWLKPEVMRDYDKYRDMFERELADTAYQYHRIAGPRLPEFVREVSWKRYEDEILLCLEDMSEIPCPEYDLLGLCRPEALNAEINAPELAGIALLGADIPPVPTFLDGEPTKYNLHFDGEWL
ncbi:mat A-2 [Parachaetomium inaequale]|uniref:Mat A-2 n=1 Tax=Parachaetomium inaequale TaxID=2588326 RepID=A0AAN6SM83_9PEZI|nr:mat A-2 [Parachaetomium inaequale]